MESAVLMEERKQEHAVTDSPDITFFVPCLNEEENILGTIQTILSATAAAPVAYEILIVDDASTDNTVGVVNAYHEAHPEVPIVLEKKTENSGLGRNYFSGAHIAHGRYYMLVNGDNVEHLDTLIGLLSKLGEADILIPYFGRLDQRPLGRRIISQTFTRLVNTLNGFSIPYYNGPIVHLRQNVAETPSTTWGFAYQAELTTRLLSRGATYITLEVPGAERQKGTSKAFKIRNIASVGGSLLKIFLHRLGLNVW